MVGLRARHRLRCLHQRVDVQLDRAPLNSDPRQALAQTERIGKEIKGVAGGQDFLFSVDQLR